ncbi:hypothetical protein ACO0LB_03075 [Undibacterium sp. SXout7W]|uniref:SLAC1 family transporter n=1 Tax=Undibacterium sp. SXout7W TaxID=3413049 RepID=UPI003BEFD9F3
MNSVSALRPWLVRLPAGLFGIVLGLLSLSSGWRRLQVFEIQGAGVVADLVQMAGLVVFALLALLSVLKLIRYPSTLMTELRHPVQGAMLAIAPTCCLFIVILLLPAHMEWLTEARILVAVALLSQLLIAWHIVSQLSTGRMPADLISPALYLPIVPGGFVGAMAMKTVGLPGFAMLLFGVGLAGWALLEFKILNRLFSGPLPVTLRTTLGIEVAPATVGTLTVMTLWPELSADFLMIGIGISSGLLFAVMTRWHWLLETPFNAGFWSFSFPLGAMASCVVEAVQRGHWPAEVALTAVLLVSALVLFLSVRTMLLLWRGELLPA